VRNALLLRRRNLHLGRILLQLDDALKLLLNILLNKFLGQSGENRSSHLRISIDWNEDWNEDDVGLRRSGVFHTRRHFLKGWRELGDEEMVGLRLG